MPASVNTQTLTPGLSDLKIDDSFVVHVIVSGTHHFPSIFYPLKRMRPQTAHTALVAVARLIRVLMLSETTATLHTTRRAERARASARADTTVDRKPAIARPRGSVEASPVREVVRSALPTRRSTRTNRYTGDFVSHVGADLDSALEDFYARDGDLPDETVLDVDAVKCYICGHESDKYFHYARECPRLPEIRS